MNISPSSTVILATSSHHRSPTESTVSVNTQETENNKEGKKHNTTVKAAAATMDLSQANVLIMIGISWSCLLPRCWCKREYRSEWLLFFVFHINRMYKISCTNLQYINGYRQREWQRSYFEIRPCCFITVASRIRVFYSILFYSILVYGVPKTCQVVLPKIWKT